MRRAPLALALAASLASCAYYNGLYNAKALAGRAEKAEREGRPFDATSDWGQAAAKAETVLVHHPHSRWTEEARWLAGKAFERTGNCPAAIPPLQQTLREARDPRRADDAALRLAACQVKLGDVDAAGLSVERLLNHPDPAIRSEAAWRAGTTYRRTGRSHEAVFVLRTSRLPRARGELAAALADDGDLDGAIALADSLLAARDTLAPWAAIFASVGRRDLTQGSALLDRAIATNAFTRDSTATWLHADAVRWLARDSARAVTRLLAAHAAAPTRPAGFGALLAALRLRLATSDDPAILDTIERRFDDIPEGVGVAAGQAQSLAALAEVARARFDSLADPGPLGDLDGFLLGESLRDSLGAPRLAAVAWRRVIAGYPDSPYLPKVLLALAAIGGAPADSVAATLASTYAANPYVHALHGEDDPGFRALEDSLARFASGLGTAARPRAARRATPARPTTGRSTTPDQ